MFWTHECVLYASLVPEEVVFLYVVDDGSQTQVFGNMGP